MALEAKYIIVTDQVASEFLEKLRLEQITSSLIGMISILGHNNSGYEYSF